jgi:hypothetical protein
VSSTKRRPISWSSLFLQVWVCKTFEDLMKSGSIMVLYTLVLDDFVFSLSAVFWMTMIQTSVEFLSYNFKTKLWVGFVFFFAINLVSNIYGPNSLEFWIVVLWEESRHHRFHKMFIAMWCQTNYRKSYWKKSKTS